MMVSLPDVVQALLVGLGVMKLLGIHSLVPLRWCDCGRKETK